MRLTIALLFLCTQAFAQHEHMTMGSKTDIARDLLAQQVSGTSESPAAAPMHMEMMMWEDWMLMWHGEAFLNQVVQTDAGGDQLFPTNWIMG